MSFVHLHCHSEFSLLDASVRVDELVKKAAVLGMPAVAVTDHGNLHAAVPFYQAARKAGVKPIIGCEVYVAPGSMLDRNGSSAKDSSYHLTLLATDAEGYGNLVKLVTSAHLEGFYYKPRVDRERLAAHAKGLIALSGCVKGEVPTLIAGARMKEAKETVAAYRDIFGPENYFIELTEFGLDAQRRVNPELIMLAREFDLGLVATNDVHFLEKSHHEAHDVLICIGSASMVLDEKRQPFCV